jgi:HAD superfamily hydrolase (TIGR01549 family)
MQKAAAFDFDGTLFVTADIEFPAFNRALGRLGLPLLSEKKVISYIGSRMRDIMVDLLPHGPEDLRSRLHQYILEEESVQIERGSRLFEGVPEMLADLQSRGVPLYICSNGTPGYLEHVCSYFDLLRYFKAIYHTGNIPSKADAVASLARRHPLLVFAGDREEDIEAARAAGAASVVCAYGYGGGSDFGADHCAASAQHLHQIILDVLGLS